MNVRIGAAALVWLVFITALHVQLNVGWERLGGMVEGRRELVVGFLPVT